MVKSEIIRQSAALYETPFYLFDLDSFASRIREIQDVLGKRVTLCYAMKANPFLIRTAAECVGRLEVCSPGEFAICERARIPMEKIVLSGVYKEANEIRRVLTTYGGKGVYTAESRSQFDLLAKTAGEMGLTISVLLRLTSGNQFGMDEKLIHELVRDREQYPQLRIQGIQFYSGTQKKRKNTVQEELNWLDSLLADLKEKWNFHAMELEYGPGFFVSYFRKDENKSIHEQMGEFRQMLRELRFQGKITLEIGRYLAAECGIYATKIVDVKENQGQKYAIVDGGIHHLNYFGQTMAMKVPFFRQLDGNTFTCREDEETSPVTVCGSLCTVSDVLVKNLPLSGKISGDILVFEKTGAYSVTEGIYLFLSRDFPLILFWSEAEGLRLIRKRVESNRWNGE